MTKIRKIYNKINAAEVISFDVFDTLLIRTVYKPIDIFRIVQESFNEKSSHVVLSDFPRQRIRAEKRAYTVVGIHADIDDIYREYAALTGLSAKICEGLKTEELRIESASLHPNKALVKVYNYAKKQKKPIFVISDMYLPKTFIANVLKQNGIKGWTELIVSSHDKVGKNDGKAYAYLRQKFPTQKVLHFGDNPQSDLDQARSFGIDAELVKHTFDKYAGHKRFKEDKTYNLSIQRYLDARRFDLSATQKSIVVAQVAEMLPRRASVARLVGYRDLGPMLLGYVQWLHHMAKSAGIKHLYFLARDGAIMQKAYNSYYGSEAIPSTYLFASRRLFNFAAIDRSLTGVDLHYLMAIDAPVPARAYLERFSIKLGDPGVREAFSRVGLRPDEKVTNELRPRMKAVFLLLEDMIIQRSAAERERLKEYLRAQGVHKKNRAFVDIGWRGTMQHAAMKIMENNDIRGYYFGVHDKKYTRDKTDIEGYIDERDTLQLDMYDRLIYKSVEVIEYLFTNPEQGSIIGIKKSGDTFKPIEDSQYASLSEKKALDRLKTLQAGALDFILDFKARTSVFPENIRTLDQAAATMYVDRLLNRPARYQAKFFGGIVHQQSTGIKPRPIGAPRFPRLYYVIFPWRLVAEWKVSYWPRGFRKNARAEGLGFILKLSRSAKDPAFDKRRSV